MATENLADTISALTPIQREYVREFIDFLTSSEPLQASPFLAAVDEFIDRHPELLRRLAQ